jgi:hypothetical protein
MERKDEEDNDVEETRLKELHPAAAAHQRPPLNIDPIAQGLQPQAQP